VTRSQKFGSERNSARTTDYAELLDEIAKSPTERQQLLRNYFEPNEEEREKD